MGRFDAVELRLAQPLIVKGTPRAENVQPVVVAAVKTPETGVKRGRPVQWIPHVLTDTERKQSNS